MSFEFDFFLCVKKETMTAPNPYTANAKKAIQLLKEYTNDLEGWSLVQESKSGVKVYNKSDGSALPLLRGDTFLSGAFTPEQVAIVATFPGCRKLCKFVAPFLSLFFNTNKL